MTRRARPIECAGCYSLDLYCDQDECDTSHGGVYEGCGPAQYTASTGARARRDARRDGWVLHRDGTATCPSCNAPAPSTKEDTIEHPCGCYAPDGDVCWRHGSPSTHALRRCEQPEVKK